MNFYDVLAAEKLGGGIPTMNFFDLLFAQSMGGNIQWETYEGTLPATLDAKSANMRQYQIWGEVGGVGDKTENLFNKNSIESPAYIRGNGTINRTSGANGYAISNYIPVSAGDYVAHGLQSRGNLPHIAVYDENQELVRTVQIISNQDMALTIASNEKYVRLSVRVAGEEYQTAMFTKGATAPASFVPFGYKLDILSGIKLLQSSEIEVGAWIATIGDVPKKVSTTIRCSSKGAYPISSAKIFYDFKTLNVNIVLVDSNGISLGGTGFKSGAGSVDVPTNAVSCLFTIANTDTDDIITPAQVNAVGIWASIGATITPIYIGDDPLDKVNKYSDFVDYAPQKVVRAIKKYVLTGDEGWEEIAGSTASRDYFRWVFAPMYYCVRHILKCSHFTQTSITTSTTNVGVDVFESSSVRGEVLAIRPENMQLTALADFTAWLAEQYAAGTPVTVWVALTTAEETDPPVPLPEIPTLDGTTIIDYVGQSVAPEKVLLEYAKGGE